MWWFPSDSTMLLLLLLLHAFDAPAALLWRVHMYSLLMTAGRTSARYNAASAIDLLYQ